MASVLIVDDDQDSRETLSDLLELKGVTVLAKSVNGFDAVEKFTQYKPDIVLMDMMMPNYDGFYGLKNIKKIDSDARVIMITADQSKTTLDRINQFSHTKIIVKPIDVDELSKLILEYLLW